MKFLLRIRAIKTMSKIKTTIGGIYPKLVISPEAPRLKRSLHKFDKGDITKDDLETALKKNTAQIIKEQRAAGINVIEDGQIRWEDFYSPFAAGYTGIKRGVLKRIFDTNTLQRKPLIEGEIGYMPTTAQSDLAYAKSLLEEGEELKAILPGPFSFSEDAEDQYYENFEARVAAIAKALNNSFLAAEKAGADYIEIYDPYLYFNSYNAELLKKVYEILLAGISKTQVILGSFYGTPKKENLAALENTALAGFSLDLINSPRSLDDLSKEPKILQLGILDARNTGADDLAKAKEQIQKAQEKFEGSEILLSLNNSPEFLPRKNAIDKMKALSELKN